MWTVREDITDTPPPLSGECPLSVLSAGREEKEERTRTADATIVTRGPSMPRRCKICDHSHCEEIERLLAENRKPLREIAALAGVSISSAHRHREQHMSRASSLTEGPNADNEGAAINAISDIGIAIQRQRLTAMHLRWVALTRQLRQRSDALAKLPASALLRELRELEASLTFAVRGVRSSELL